MLQEPCTHRIGLMSSVHLVASASGARQNKRERLKQALLEERAGIQLTDATDLVVGMQNHEVVSLRPQPVHAPEDRRE